MCRGHVADKLITLDKNKNNSSRETLKAHKDITLLSFLGDNCFRLVLIALKVDFVTLVDNEEISEFNSYKICSNILIIFFKV